jgi:hypothetical protein
VAKPEWLDFRSGCFGIEQQVPPGDPDVQGARTHVGSDISRPEVEKLGVVPRVWHGKRTQVPSAGVTGLNEHVDGSL